MGDPSDSLSSLIEQAMAIKSEQLAQDRRKFDKWPRWMRNSLFSDPEIALLRSSGTFEQRYQYACGCREAAKPLFRAGEIDHALHEYEKALGVFHWVESSDPDWRTKGIVDSNMSEHEFTPENDEDVDELNELRVALILNIVTCLQKQELWDESVRACDEVLLLDPGCAKAFYKRAQARIVPKNCGMAENELALQDLALAMSYGPGEAIYARAHRELKAALKIARQQEKNHFKGFLEKNSKIDEMETNTAEQEDEEYEDVDEEAEVDDSSTGNESNLVPSSKKLQKSRSKALKARKRKTSKKPPSYGTMSVDDALNRISDMEAYAAQLRADGKIEEAMQLEQNAKESRDFIAEIIRQAEENGDIPKSEPLGKDDMWEFISNADFENPSEEMIQEAMNRGIDLTDRKIQKLMRDIHKETLAFRGTSEGDSIFEEASDEVRQEKINSLLRKAMFRMRRSMSRDIATKIVSGLKASKFRDMLLSRRVGRYKGRTEDDDMIGPQVEEILSLTEDDIISRIKDLQQCSDAEIQEMLICSLVDDLVELEGKREENTKNESLNETSVAPVNEVKQPPGDASTSDAAATSTDSNDLLGKMLSGTDPKGPKENDEFVKTIYNMIFEKYGGKDIIEFEGVVEKKEDSYLSWLPMGIAITFGIIFLVLHLIAFFNNRMNTDAMVPKGNPMSKPRPTKFPTKLPFSRRRSSNYDDGEF